MSKRDEFVATLKAKLDRWNAEVDALEVKAQEKKANIDRRLADRLTTVKQKRDEARRALTEIGSASGSAWESLRAGAERIWEELGRTLEESKNAFADGARSDDRA